MYSVPSSVTRSAVALLFVCFCRATFADVEIRPGTVARFASIEEGRRILTTRDEFIERLSPFDRAARVKTDKEISEQEFLQFVGARVSAWTPEEQRAVEARIDSLWPALTALPISLPKIVYFIKTTGAEEGNAFYTRGHGVMIPQKQLGMPAAKLEQVIAHELFHILSRENPALRESLYGTIGFARCEEAQLPPSLRARKITNPDAPRNDHFIRLKTAGREVMAVPVLFANVEKYDVKRGGEFFDYLQFAFLPIDTALGNAPASAEPKLLASADVTGFADQIGKNTNYTWHPEEILAENFALIVRGETEVPTPELLDKIRRVLAGK